MREIKFRAWDKISKRMYVVQSVSFNDDLTIKRIYLRGEKYGEVYELISRALDDVILMQYTGMHDSEGNDIYEGDIVQIPDDWDEYGMNCGEIYEVYFAFGGFRLKPKYTTGRGFYVEEEKVLIHLGNIYENPELLEETK